MEIDAGVRLALIPLRSSFLGETFDRPIAVKIQLNDACNARCRMCNHWRRPVRRRSLWTPDFLVELLDQLAVLGTRVVRYTGGEPTLRSDLACLIAQTRAAGIIPELNTHAMQIDSAMASALVDAGLRRACVSIHADTSVVHDAIFGATGAWDKAWGGIDALRRAGPPDRLALRIHTVVMQPNLGAVSGLPALAAARGVDELHLQPVEVGHLRRPQDRLLALLPEDADRFNRQTLPPLLGECRRLGLRTNVAAEPSLSPIVGLGQHGPQRGCFRPHYHVLITEEGNLYPCSQLNDDDLVIGNVFDTRMAELLDGPRHREVLRRLHVGHSTCRTCTWQLKRNHEIDQALGVLAACEA